MPKRKPSINHIRVLQWIDYHRRLGTDYAPAGASYKRAQELVDFGLATRARGLPASGLQHFAATQAGLELLARLDEEEKGKNSQRYWLRDRVRPFD